MIIKKFAIILVSLKNELKGNLLLQLNQMEEALDDIGKGKIVLIYDDKDRENEGDFIVAADFVKPEIINFMAKYGRGLICVALTEERCNELSLEKMVKNNTSAMSTNFTVSVDLIGNGCTTGISVFDRAKTIKALVSQSTRPEDLGRPGHIFPLISHPLGVLGRRGHTEAAVDLARLAGLYPAGVLVEVMNEDGSMARLNELYGISQQHLIKIISINQIVQYRQEKESEKKCYQPNEEKKFLN